MEVFLFCFFSSFAILSGAFVAFIQSPIASIFYLVLAFCNISGLLFLLEVEFLALLFIIVYVGAIAVLFLFVIIILSLKSEQKNSVNFFSKKSAPLFVIISSFSFFCIFSYIDFNSFAPIGNSFLLPGYIEWVVNLDSLSSIHIMGQLLYTKFFCLFLIAGLVLLTAILGSITLTADYQAKKNSKRKQLVYQQLSRSASNAVFKVKREKNCL